MRIWDVSTGFLNNNSLLGEHKELHGIFNIVTMNKKGYSKHPETIRWVKCDYALYVRHNMLVAEMILRGFKHHSSITVSIKSGNWPSTYIDIPQKQYGILENKYLGKQYGRIPLPQSTFELFDAYQYTVMLRNQTKFDELKKEVNTLKGTTKFVAYSELFTQMLRQKPKDQSIRKVLVELVNLIEEQSVRNQIKVGKGTSTKLIFQNLWNLVIKHDIKEVKKYTAITDIAGWKYDWIKQ